MPFEHNFPYDPTGGYSLEQLKAVRLTYAEPADLDAFWLAAYAAAMSAPLAWTLTPSPEEGTAATEVYHLEYAGMRGNRVGGWLTKPRGRAAMRAVVLGHGYGGRQAPELLPPIADAVVIQPVCTGLPSRSLCAGVSGDAGLHVLTGIEAKDTYVIRDCVQDLWRAASVVLEAFPESSARLDYMGTSFGGGTGALALGWDRRFASGYLCVPTFGNHPVRLRLQSCGSGEAVRLYAQSQPGVLDVLAYFDSAFAARRIAVPMLVAAAEFDPAVIPPGQFSVYNEMACTKQLHVMPAGHYEYPQLAADDAATYSAVQTFFARPL